MRATGETKRMPRSSGPDARYVALLRGVNVGRAVRIAMADLRALVRRAGYREAATLLNSGNVTFAGLRSRWWC
jgi:uncharacterized protein (DUF1697 family)